MVTPSGPGLPTERHENGMSRIGSDLYLIGGRGTKSVERYSGGWEATGTATPDWNHFQAVTYDDQIWLAGAMKGNFQSEKPLQQVQIYDPETDSFSTMDGTLEARARGAAGTAVYCDRIYLVGGMTEGHGDDETDVVGWFDRFDPAKGQWEIAGDDMPHPRDHFHAVVVGHRLYAIGGRTTDESYPDFFDNLVPEVDVYDFLEERWLPAGERPEDLPTPRAAAAVAALGSTIYVIGGETGDSSALGTVERLDTLTGEWSTVTFAPLPGGRHGTQAVACGDAIYLAAGSTTRGGDGETDQFDVYRPTPDTPGC